MFKVSREAAKAGNLREFKTLDLVKRLGVITANRVHLKNYPVENPTTIFNPSLSVENETIRIYLRIVLGYFTYTSAVAMLEAGLSDIYEGYLSVSHYPVELILCPDSEYDFWGIEDPRVYRIDDKLMMTYCGRTVNYFNPAIRVERTLPITAVSKDLKNWRKNYVFRLTKEIRKQVVSDKDAFLLKTKKRELFLFHRPHLTDENFYLAVSKVPIDILEKTDSGLSEVVVTETTVLMNPASFEAKLGWATPPVEVGGGEYLLLVHGVDRRFEGYRVFAVLLSCEEEVRLTAVTPHYIMEPKMSYELYGERPYTVFPCGIQKAANRLLVTYGAADSAVGVGEIEIDKLLPILDRHRLKE
ncbi:hypothetical protein [Candidatus Hecatella orcuttiae]|jgi:predicted GH43/DUF377 family glycosyl hydrolase|uniref:glycoside hydrolase family 130 protein n=1 Tax=Candidatus Hecatella orcuttiae TaxID=1935119 RepID=UPI002867C31A|nr:hypothetical protein [Candidatus Hecatella orcuttiae]